MPAPPENFKKKLTVLSCKEVHRGQGRDGTPFVMYEVEALDESGKRVGPQTGQQLRSFDELPLNKLIEYDVRPKDTERHGRTYTLVPPRPPLWQRVDALERRVKQLEVLLEGQAQGRNVGPESQDPAPEEVPAAAPAPEPPQTW